MSEQTQREHDHVRQVTGWDDVKIINPVIVKMQSVSLVPVGTIGFVLVAELEDGSHVGLNVPFGVALDFNKLLTITEAA